MSHANRLAHTNRSVYVNRLACAPGTKEHFDQTGTCYNDKMLIKMIKSFNKLNPSDQINIDQIRNESSGGGNLTQKLWKNLKSRVKDCPNEWCWLNKKFVKRIKDPKLHMFTFKPKIPKGKDTWLSTIDIERVMDQFQEYDPTFKFLGAVPIDFETAPHYKHTFQNMNLDDLKRQGFTKIAIVLNTDPHDEPGAHWISCFIDTKLREFQFFDSLGKRAPKQVTEWFKRLNADQDPKYYFVWNDTPHQLENNECGVYSLNFIIHRLLGVPFKQYVKNVHRDAQMNQQRNIIFLPAKYQ